VPSAERNHPRTAPVPAQRRRFRRLDRILLTHGHFDHVLGIPGLFSTLRLRQSTEEMTVHGSPGTIDPPHANKIADGARRP
jgi:ribonuclease BN (tRNA processing enzyme)